jgi:DNA-binding transcriptional MerR regulator
VYIHYTYTVHGIVSRVKSLSKSCTLDLVSSAGYLRIGELSRRSGVSRELLRAWERRYGILRPTRSNGGFRLYSRDDERRIELMRAHIARGLAPAEAARLAVDGATEARRDAPASAIEPRAGELREALDALDESAAHAALDRLLAELTLETVLGRAVLPYLRELGDRWQRGEASVGQEHFASSVLRGRLLGLARGWDRGAGPRALLACAPGEQHDLGLIAFGLSLRDRGWRITFLGADTPLDTLAETAALLRPAAVVLVSTMPEHLAGAGPALASLAEVTPLFLAGAGASAGVAAQAGAELLAEDPLTAAERVATRA